MTASSRTGSAMRSSLSTPGLATVGLGKFNIGALHAVIQQPDANSTLEQCDDFFPGGLGVPDSFQGEGPRSMLSSFMNHRRRLHAPFSLADCHQRTQHSLLSTTVLLYVKNIVSINHRNAEGQRGLVRFMNYSGERFGDVAPF